VPKSVIIFNPLLMDCCYIVLVVDSPRGVRPMERFAARAYNAIGSNITTLI